MFTKNPNDYPRVNIKRFENLFTLLKAKHYIDERGQEEPGLDHLRLCLHVPLFDAWVTA